MDSLPPYVLEHAPIVYLHPREPFWPASTLAHVQHCPPSKLADVAIDDFLPSELRGTLASLAAAEVNDDGVHLTSRDDVRKDRTQAWLVSQDGRPDANGRSGVGEVFLIVVQKDNVAPQTVDAFWFFFYSFNLGAKVAGAHWGNHVADWEHCMVRFVRGVPMAVHLSSHSDGYAYAFDCLDKLGQRPVMFSAIDGLYPTAGSFAYSPAGRAGPVDRTEKGPLWDPAMNFRAFRYRPDVDDFTAFDEEKDGEYAHCLRFRGKWGDRFSVPVASGTRFGGIGFRGFSLLSRVVNDGQWADGVTGPRDKSLDRVGMNRWNDDVRRTIR